MFKKVLVVILSLAGSVFLYWGYRYVTRDLPSFNTVDDYRPPAVSSVYSSDGTLIAEFYKEKRYPVKLQDIPLVVRNSFLAAEDASFYRHPGIDPMSILRAAVKNLKAGSSTQGGSTITQQVVKNLLLTPEKKITRKLKEAILSYRLEKRLSKDGILELYLNQIFFGNTAYGVKAASRIYYHKELDQLSLAESAMLAALPKAPSRYSPLQNMQRAKRRQKYVLAQMVDAKFITQEEADRAFEEKLEVFPATQKNIFHAPYFVTEVRSELGKKFKDLDIDSEGLSIYTSVDVNADEMATKSLKRGLKSVDKRRGWRGVLYQLETKDRGEFLKRYPARSLKELEEVDVYPALVRSVNRSLRTIEVDLGKEIATVDLRNSNWANRKRDADQRVYGIKIEDAIRVGDVIEVSLITKSNDESTKDAVPSDYPLQLDQTPDIEGSLVLLNPHSGQVVAMEGGYSYEKSVFNRVTQSYRQPGSSFKPIVYLSAIDGFDYTPSTIVHDEPMSIKWGDEVWSPKNYDEKYMGPITLQRALELSRNMVSVDIVSRIGLNAIIKYAKKLGIESPIGRNLSISLGTSEVTMLELARAYGVFAANGVLFKSTFINKILDRTGKEIYNWDNEKLSQAEQVIDEKSAFIMAHVMTGTIQRGTATSLKVLGRPIAGKTGTTNDQMDAWFIGYTPQWVCGVWVGFDQKKEIGNKETGGKVSAPIWLDFMKDFLKYSEDKNYEEQVKEAKSEAERLGIEYVPPQRITAPNFPVPSGVEGYWVDRGTGKIVPEGSPDAIYEYFKIGTEPKADAPAEESAVEDYLESPDL